MAEPDFDQIATTLAMTITGRAGLIDDDVYQEREAIAAALRQVWNARGKADIATMDTTPCRWSGTDAGVFEALASAIRSLDR